jgi:hypothetical protein
MALLAEQMRHVDGKAGIGHVVRKRATCGVISGISDMITTAGPEPARYTVRGLLPNVNVAAAKALGICHGKLPEMDTTVAIGAKPVQLLLF